MKFGFIENVIIFFIIILGSSWISESKRGKPLISIRSLPNVEYKVIYMDKKVVLLKQVFDSDERYYLDRSLINPEISVGDRISFPDGKRNLVKC